MFDIITKEEYWQWIEEGLAQSRDPSSVGRGRHLGRSPAIRAALERFSSRFGRVLKPPRPYELKDVQDAFILSRLSDTRGARILEVGGGRSRILPLLSSSNECWVVDKFEGKGRGPTRVPRLPGIKTVHAFMGDLSGELMPSYFDFVVSISVMEHVPLDSMNAFFQDCSRVLKTGGNMLHAVDTYLFDVRDSPLARPFEERIEAYLSFANRPDLGIKLTQEPRVDQNLRFSCRYASQPDNILHEWNLNRPSVKRVIGQVVTLKTEWIKTSEGRH